VERVTSEPATTPPVEDELVITPVVVVPPLSMRARWTSGLSILVAGLITIFVWGIGADPNDAVFSLSDGARVHVPDITVSPGLASLVLGCIILLLGVWQIARGFSRASMKWVLAAVIACFLFAFLCWAGSANTGAPINLLGLLQNTLFLAVPLILGALSGILCERTGVINIAIEGQFLAGAFAGALAATMADNLGVGVVAAIIAGGLIGAMLAVFAIKYQVNQVVLGVVINVFALGLTGFGYDALMQTNAASYNEPGFLSPIKIPLLGDIPVIGPVLFDANIIVYLTYGLIILIDVALFRTRWGLRSRAVGEHPRAADTVGIKVLRTRYRNVIMGGMVAGLGGAYLTIGAVGSFTKNISSGKGFIALAAVIFGRWSPRGAIGAALLFGFADGLQTLLSVVGTPVAIPSAFLSMLPYLATLFAVAGLVGRVQAPAADGEPYVKG
jgi:general nucleoside transport system permease protein